MALRRRHSQKQLKEAKAQLALPWEHEQEYNEKTKRLNQLDIVKRKRRLHTGECRRILTAAGGAAGMGKLW